jgi:hypothetical protein
MAHSHGVSRWEVGPAGQIAVNGTGALATLGDRGHDEVGASHAIAGRKYSRNGSRKAGDVEGVAIGEVQIRMLEQWFLALHARESYRYEDQIDVEMRWLTLGG